MDKVNIKEFIHYCQDFIVYLDVERNIAENTLRAYKSDLKQLQEFWEHINSTANQSFTITHVLDRFFVTLYHKKMEKSSIARKVSCFKSLKHYIQKEGGSLKINIIRPRVEKKLPIYLSIDEIFHLLDQVNDEELPTKKPLRDKAILELLYASGIRCSELVMIKLSDIDLEQKLIRIQGKGRRERMALFGQKAKERLILFLQDERPTPKNPEEYLFVNQQGSHLTSRSVQRILQMFRSFLKIDKHITPHKIRHSFATHLLNQGVDLRAVQELLGHQTISTTQRYTHVTTTQLMNMCDTLHPYNSFDQEK